MKDYYAKFPATSMSAFEMTETEALLCFALEQTDEGRKELKRVADSHQCHYRDIVTKSGPHRYYIKKEINELSQIVAINRERRNLKR